MYGRVEMNLFKRLEKDKGQLPLLKKRFMIFERFQRSHSTITFIKTMFEVNKHEQHPKD